MLGIELSRQDALKMFGLNIRFVSGKNTAVYDEQGQKYIDGLSQYGVLPFGHANEKLYSHCKKFFDTENLTYLQPFTTDYVAQFKENLLKRNNSLFQHVILTTSGAESVETAIKMVRSKTGKDKILALDSAFHGKTCTALQLTDNPAIQDFFKIKKSFSEHFSREKVSDLIDRVKNDENVSAVFIELVQGEGGMQPVDIDSVQAIYRACKETGVLFVVDEIQTGMGRTGTLFAYEQFNVEPDIMLLAKALGGGVAPIGACLAKEHAYPKAFDLYHSSTFAHNNFTAYVADYVLSEMNDEIFVNVKEKELYLQSKLQEVVELYPNAFSHVTGKGLMWGMHLKPWEGDDNFSINHMNRSGSLGFIIAAWLIKVCKFITMPCYSNPFCLRIQPALNCSFEDIDYIVDCLTKYGKQANTKYGYKNIFLANNSEDDSIVPARKANQKKTIKNKDTDTDFVFIIHLIDDATLKGNLPPFYPELKEQEQDDCFVWFKQMLGSLTPQPHFWYESTDLNLRGMNLRGSFYGVPLFPSQMLNLTTEQSNYVTQKIADITLQSNADTLGLGAYSSIIAKGGYKLRHLNKKNINVTPGSSMTAYSAFKVWEKDRSKQSDCVGIIGANGDIGKFIMAMLIEHIFNREDYSKSVMFFYNPENNSGESQLIQSFVKVFRYILQQLSSSKTELIQELIDATSTIMMSTEELFERINQVFEKVLGRQVFAFLPSDNISAVKEVDSLFLCTNFPGELKLLNDLEKDVSIYDVTIPSNISQDLITSKNITVHQSGLFKLPDDISFGSYNICGLPPGVTLGCLTETILMSAAKKLFPFKSGWQQYKRLGGMEELVQHFQLEPVSLVKGRTH